jgi:AraC-like DNA-binding protein
MSIAVADFAPVRFSTEDFPERERLARWREEFGRGMLRLEIEPLSSDLPFHAKATFRALPGVRMVKWAGSATRLTRTRTMVADSDGSIGLVVNVAPRAAASQRSADVALEAGDGFPIVTDDLAVLTTSRHLSILLPRAVLTARVSDLDRRVMRVIPRTVEPLRLLVSYITLVREEASLGTAELRQTVVSHIHDLAALALGANRDTRESGLNAIAAARLAAALAHIAEDFTEPELTLVAVAHRQGVTPRYLQQLLEKSGRSFTTHVNELRLQRAFALLTEPHTRGGRISEIALQAGFSDVSHFNRLFRARFGDTPSGIRAGATRLNGRAPDA